MEELRVLDIGCGTSEFIDNWLSSRTREPEDLHYRENPDKRPLRNTSQAITQLLPQVESIEVLGIDQLGGINTETSKTINNISVSVSSIETSFHDFTDRSIDTVGKFDVAMLAHPSRLDILRLTASNGIEKILKQSLKPNGITLLATDHTQCRAYKTVIEAMRARFQGIGLLLDPNAQFDTSWSRYYLPEKTDSFVFRLR